MRACEEWETNCGKGVSVYSDAYVYDKPLGSPSQSYVLKLFAMAIYFKTLAETLTKSKHTQWRLFGHIDHW